MIDAAYVRLMARYNRWQNENLYGTADGLPDAERRCDRGAFFRSIHETCNHLLWADRMWMSRFSGGEQPPGGMKESVSLYTDWGALKTERRQTDAAIMAWADGIDAAALAGDLTWYSGGAQRSLTGPRWKLVVHFFNHQTHHRGQIHAMLTQAGARPGDTDLPLMSE
jgi:uncharacterized damage-inducible protein DinB